MVANQAQPIGEFIADDWVIVGADGSVDTKAPFLSLIESGDLTHNVMETRDMNVRIYGETAVTVATGLSGGHYRNEPFLINERMSCAYVRKDGRWRCVLTHLSLLSEPEK